MQMIGRDMLIDGVPASVYGMEFDASPDAVSNQFRDYWTRANVPARGQRDASGWLLSALDGACHYVLLVPPRTDGSPTKGLMSVVRLDGARRHRIADAGVPLPEGGNARSDVESRDGRQTGRTWVVELTGSTGDHAERYLRRLQEDGWRVVAHAPARRLDGSQRVVGDAFAMQRGSDRLDAVFTQRNGRTEAVIHATTGA